MISERLWQTCASTYETANVSPSKTNHNFYLLEGLRPAWPTLAIPHCGSHKSFAPDIPHLGQGTKIIEANLCLIVITFLLMDMRNPAYIIVYNTSVSTLLTGRPLVAIDCAVG